MKRPSFQFYPSDWVGNSNLKRCTHAEKGVWLEIMCLLHDSEEYGLLRWPLKEIIEAIKCKPEEVARVGHAMRKWIKENDLPYIYRLQARYHSDGMGRLWLLDAPQKAETTKLKKVA